MSDIVAVIGYSLPGEITLAGVGEDIACLAYSIACKATRNVVQLYLPNDSPEPFQAFIAEIQIINTVEPLRLTSDGQLLVIAGSLEQRQALAHELLQVAEPSDYDVNHVHRYIRLQYYPGHPFLAATSLTLVISVVNCGNGGPVQEML